MVGISENLQPFPHQKPPDLKQLGRCLLYSNGPGHWICQVRSMASLERSSRTSSTVGGATRQPLLVTCEVFLSWKVSAAWCFYVWKLTVPSNKQTFSKWKAHAFPSKWLCKWWMFHYHVQVAMVGSKDLMLFWELSLCCSLGKLDAAAQKVKTFKGGRWRNATPAEKPLLDGFCCSKAILDKDSWNVSDMDDSYVEIGNPHQKVDAMLYISIVLLASQ